MNIKEARISAGLSRAEMSRRFEIPLRTLENWESDVNQPPAWVEKLIVEKLNSIAAEATSQ
jgi:DNA-binding transcriptional regulator YiaG